MDDDLARAQAWAEWIGQHAMPVFTAILITALLAATAAFGAVSRYGGRVLKQGMPRPVLLGICLALGAGVLLAMAGVFAEMMEAMQADEEIGLFDERLSETLSRELSGSTLRLFAMATHLGDPITLTGVVVAVGILLIVRGRALLAVGWAAACGGGTLLNFLLKQIFERVRPVHDHGFSVADGFSFPSGHTTGSVVIYGMLAFLCVRLMPPRWHLPGVLLATTLAITMGFSRVILQVHWASDVIAGFAFGLGWLTVCVAAMEFTRFYARSQRPGNDHPIR